VPSALLLFCSVGFFKEEVEIKGKTIFEIYIKLCCASSAKSVLAGQMGSGFVLRDSITWQCLFM